MRNEELGIMFRKICAVLSIIITAVILLITCIPFEGTVDEVRVKADEKNNSSGAKQYTVTFHINGGVGTTPAAEKKNPGSTIQLPDDNGFSRVNYVFKCWNTKAEGDGLDYSAGSAYVVTDDTYLYAKWNREYTISFDGNGGSGEAPADMKQENGLSITLPGGGGFTNGILVFDGWNTEDDGTGTPYAAYSEYQVTGDATLFAVWSEYYTVTIYKNDGTTDTVFSRNDITYEESITLPAAISRDGYTFGGWNTTDTPDTGTSYPAASSYQVKGSIDLFAKWVCTITFDTGSGGSVVVPQTVIPGDTASRPGTNPTRSGFTFVDWYSDSGCENLYDFDAPVNTNTTVYAGWGYLVQFISEGSPVDPQVVLVGKTAIRPPDPTRDNYAFDDWYNSDLSGVKFQFSTIITGPREIYAKWTSEVSFHINNGAGTTPDPKTVSSGESTTLPGQGNLVRNGYHFAGWNTAHDGSGTTYTDSYKPDGNITLFAKWNVYSYTINYYENGVSVTGTMESIVLEYNASLTANAFTRVNHLFLGWDESPRGGSDYSTVVVHANSRVFNPDPAPADGTPINLYAVWCPVTVEDVVPDGYTGSVWINMTPPRYAGKQLNAGFPIGNYSGNLPSISYQWV